MIFELFFIKGDNLACSLKPRLQRERNSMFKIAITSLNNFQNGACTDLRVWKETVGLKQYVYCCCFYLTKGDQARNSIFLQDKILYN